MSLAFVRAGCRVSVLCRPDHPVVKIKGIAGVHRHNHFRPIGSLHRAIDESKPDLIVPCDDRAVTHLHRLHSDAKATNGQSSAIRTLIERSLGRPESFPLLTSRSQLPTIAAMTGVLLPTTAVIRSVDELSTWLRENGLPAVLKVDGTWGGQWVSIVHNESEAREAFDRLSSRQSAARAVVRLVARKDPELLVNRLSGARPIVSVQSFIRGTLANCSVACWQGQVLAGIAVEVVATQSALGHATAVRVVDAPQMLDVARRIVGGLSVSGFCGFDFILHESTGEPYLLEINPRATQINHLALGPGRDLAAALGARVADEPVRCAPPVTSCDLIALFPHQWSPSAGEGESTPFYADVPHEEPALIDAFTHRGGLTDRLSRRAGALRR